VKHMTTKHSMKGSNKGGECSRERGVQVSGLRGKPVVAMDLSSTGAGGGPFVSNQRVMKSGLQKKYDFRVLVYRTEIGRFISIRRILDLRRQLLKIKPDIVHFAGLQLSGIHMAIACRLAGIRKTVVTVHGSSIDAMTIGPLRRAIMGYMLEPITLLLSKRAYGVSRYVASRGFMGRFAKGSCPYIYNIPPGEQAFVASDRTKLRQSMGIAATDTVVVSVGRIIRDKGYHILDEAILKCTDLSKLKFVVVGDGAYLSEMKEKLSSLTATGCVFFTGYREDVASILDAADVFVLPTLHETLSIALLEASRAGLALIGSNTGGVPEIVEHGENGFLVAPGDADDLANAIRRLHEQPCLRKKFGDAARKLVDRKFCPRVIESQIDAVYQELLRC